ncbi:RCC1 domain-containing protein 1 [Aphomia sociella]
MSSKAEIPFDVNSVDLLKVNWSYNIFKTDKTFFITHAWYGEDRQLSEVSLPEKYEVSGIENLTLTGNDYKLIFIDKKKLTLWVIDLENNSNIKKLNFNEIPLDSSPKKARKDHSIKKVMTTNNLFVCLTEDGLVYSGIPPSLLDTSHCMGTICDVQCGYEHCMLLTDTGRVYTWGNGRRLQLGHGDLENLDLPTEIEALAGIKIIKISAGGWHSLALSEFGDLYAWGWNDTGQLGIKYDVNNKENSQTEDLKSYALPTVVDLYNEKNQHINLNVKDMACGTRHTAVLLEDNSVWAAGSNKYGQLGFPMKVHEKAFYFKKSYSCDHNVELLCGPWSTVLKCK